jgi:hypothetical protein
MLLYFAINIYTVVMIYFFVIIAISMECCNILFVILDNCFVVFNLFNR